MQQVSDIAYGIREVLGTWCRFQGTLGLGIWCLSRDASSQLEKALGMSQQSVRRVRVSGSDPSPAVEHRISRVMPRPLGRLPATTGSATVGRSSTWNPIASLLVLRRRQGSLQRRFLHPLRGAARSWLRRSATARASSRTAGCTGTVEPGLVPTGARGSVVVRPGVAERMVSSARRLWFWRSDGGRAR